MAFVKCTTIAIMMLLMIVSFSFSQTNLENESTSKISSIITVDTSNNDTSMIWVRPNGSDPGFPYNGANVLPSYGMNYFKTNIIKSLTYTFSDIANDNLFPSGCKVWMSGLYDASYYTTVANEALVNPKIYGVFIDDFQVGQQSSANMSAIYNNLHHEDANLSRNLTLNLVVYQSNYFKQTPYTWDNIDSYFDSIEFWFAPITYGLLWQGLAGYSDDFMTFRSWIPDKDFWLGIYLHYYNLGSYPLNFTSELLRMQSTLLKQGYASKISILENFWIQHNRETAELIRDYIDIQYKSYYTSQFYVPTTIFSYRNGTPIIQQLITNVRRLQTGSESLIFDSLAFQNLTLYSTGDYTVLSTWKLINLRTCEYINGTWNIYSLTMTYTIQANQSYRIVNFPITTYLTLNEGDSALNINADTEWKNYYVTINGILRINETLNTERTIIRFGNNHYNDSLKNFTTPAYGIKVYDTDNAKLWFWNTIIEPINRYYPYFINTTTDWWSGVGYPTGNGQTWHFDRSYIACAWGSIRPAGHTHIEDTSFYQNQPDGSNWHFAVVLKGTNVVVTDVFFRDISSFNYPTLNSVGIVIIPGYLHDDPTTWKFQNVTIIGSHYGLWADLSYSYSDDLICENTSVQGYSTNDNLKDPAPFVDYCEFYLDGNMQRTVEIQTETIFDWSVKSNTPHLVSITIYWTNLENGIWRLTTNYDTYTLAVTSQQLYFTYGGAWNPYMNNYTLIPYSTFADTSTSLINLVWLLIFFILPIAMENYIPKLGFIVGMSVMLGVFGIGDLTFMPYMIMGFIALGILIYKGGG